MNRQNKEKTYFLEEKNHGSQDQTQKNGRKEGAVLSRGCADSRYPRDGRFIEEIGTYNPLTDPATVAIDAEKAKAWIANGAQPTDTVRALLKKNGVL